MDRKEFLEKEICENCKYYDNETYKEKEVCIYSALINKGFPEELPERRTCISFKPKKAEAKQ
jgi:hypothetical protein